VQPDPIVPMMSSRASTTHGHCSSSATNHEAERTRSGFAVTLDVRVQEVEQFIVRALHTFNQLEAASKWDALERIVATLKEGMGRDHLGALANDLSPYACPTSDNQWDSDWSINS